MRRALGCLYRHKGKLSLLVLAALAAVGWAAWSRWTTTQLLRQGEAALAARNYGAARDSLERYLSARPADARARLLAARCARRAHSYYEAREHLDRCRTDGGDAEAIAIEGALIDVQRGDERPVPGLRERAERDDDLALVILEVLIQHDVDTDQLSLALSGLNRYLTRRPDDLQALLGRASVWERFLSFKDALDDYRRAVAAHPDNELARLHLADTLLIAGTPSEALTHYQWLQQRAPQRPEVRLGLARCWRRLGKPDDARNLLDELLAESPDQGDVQWERGQLALDEEKPAEAEPHLRRAADLIPNDRRVHYALYRCLLDLNRSSDADKVGARLAQIDADLVRLRQLRQEVMDRPNDAASRLEGGLLLLRNGERRESARWLRLAVRLDPASQAAREALAKVESPAAP